MDLVSEIDDRDFEREVLLADGLVVVDFWAPWCGPCQMLTPVLKEVARKYEGRVRVVKLNVDVNSNWASKLQVRGIPAVFFFRDGKTVDVQVGYASEAELVRKLDALLTPAA